MSDWQPKGFLYYSEMPPPSTVSVDDGVTKRAILYAPDGRKLVRPVGFRITPEPPR